MMDFPFSDTYDVLAAIAGENADTMVINGLTLMPEVTELYYDHIVHPNELGFQIYACRLYEALIPMIVGKT